MILVVDVGNTNTVLGVYDGETLLNHWRLATRRGATVDEYGILSRNLFSLAKIDSSKITGVIIASVVPPLDPILRQMAVQYFHLQPMFVEPGVKTGLAVKYDPPQDVGADRIVNGVAALKKYSGPLIVVDFGTATTFDAISKKGEYLGGVIAPGIGISSEALFERAARLPRVDIRPTRKVIGTSTVGSMQSGLFYGYVGLVEGIIVRMKKELGSDTKVVATGGQAEMIAGGTDLIDHLEPDLILEGLRIIYELNA
ncbi:MAG: type III pantothenate kinase [Acidobacteriia bacterium]|nr:type III pantothenate kinase [Terriglobia bacterium]